ncbi:TetR/AcrR family transcriptional regulator [Paenibacillus sp.]|uniref:TetR/AcrR family transcriptional regulator n=1 Tax=Paenibacillus sp. TaxID=58172 RepID=UPI002D617B27|nr:TetR/AcrR family transcriptional regulator [Paenibacillus sp.]HZG84176.1 TetR/AcrR family transcriptional regulator [Paenibacillus sp.]
MSEYLPRKERITLSAIDIIHELGLQGLTTREIAKREGVSEAALYRHFKNRDEIVAAVVTYYGRFDQSIVRTTEQLQMEALPAVLFITGRLAEYYEGYPAVTAIGMAFRSLQSDRTFTELTTDIYRFRTETVERLLRQAEKDGALRPAAKPELLSLVIWSAFYSQVNDWRAAGYRYPLAAKSSETISMLLELAVKQSG